MATASTRPGVSPPATRLTPDLVKVIGVVVLGTVVIQLDGTMVVVAVDTLRREFAAPVATIQWVLTGYLLAMAVVIPLSGWAVDRFGAARVWMVALAGFLTGSLLCGLAWSAPSLIIFRVVQGLGGGLLLPLAQTILAQAAGPQRLGRVMAAMGLTTLLGPVLGGVLVAVPGWRSIFLINVPVCLAGLIAARRVLPRKHTACHTGRIDLLGVALLPPGLVAVVYGLSAAGAHAGFTAPGVLVPVLVGIILLVGFTVHALRRHIVAPLIDLRLFAARAFAASTAVLVLLNAALIGELLLITLYFQHVRGADALHAGLLLAPWGVGLAVGLTVAGRLTDRLNPRPLAVTGVILATAGMVIYTQAGPATPELTLSAALLITGAGFGAALVPATATAYRGLAPAQIPQATSTARCLQQLGGSLGAALLAVVLPRQTTPAAGTHPAALATAYEHTFWWAAALTAAALVPALLLPRPLPDRRPRHRRYTVTSRRPGRSSQT